MFEKALAFKFLHNINLKPSQKGIRQQQQQLLAML